MFIKKAYLFLLLFLSFFGSFAQEPKLILPIGHTTLVNSAVFSPDGKKVLTASPDHTAIIWDAASGKLLHKLMGHLNTVSSAEFSFDGTKVVTVSFNSIVVWDVVTGKMLNQLKGHNSWVSSAKFSSDGTKIVTASEDSTAIIWDATSCKPFHQLKGHTSKVSSAEFSYDGTKIVTTSQYGGAIIWDAASGKILRKMDEVPGSISSAEFSSDDTKIVTASPDSIAIIWDVASGKPIHQLKGHTHWVSSAEFSSDGTKIVTASRDSTAIIWDVASGKPLHLLKGHRDEVFSSQFSPDGTKIVTASSDGTSIIWDATSGKILHKIDGIPGSVYSAEFSPESKRIVIASWYKEAMIWDVTTGKLLQKLKGHTGKVFSAEFSLDGKMVVTTSTNIVMIWDITTGKLLQKLKGHTDWVSSAEFSSDGTKIVTVSGDGTAIIWDVASGKPIHLLKGHRKEVLSSQFSPDGTKIVTASQDGTAIIWDALNGNPLHKLEGHTARFSPDGTKVVTSSGEGTAIIWDVASGKLLDALDGDKDVFNSARYSPDGTKIVTTSTYGGAIIWDAISGRLLHKFEGHNYVFSAKFSPDGAKVVTASEDYTAIIWDAVSGKQISTFNFEMNSLLEDINWKNQTAVVSNNSIISLFDLNTGNTMYNFFAVDSTDYLVVDPQNRYDGTPGARKLLYFTCNDEVIELEQLKDQLWVPNLAERIMKGDSINAKTLSELNICGLTPEVEDKSSVEQFRYEIRPRRGGLGETVVFINGIEARSYKPAQLKKSGEVYELILTKTELDNYFIAGRENPVTVKAFTADNAISSRGIIINEDKTQEKTTTPPNLYAVMVGVSDYKDNELDLKYAAKDANDISNAVAAAARKLLNTDSKEHVFIYDLTTSEKRYQLPEKNSIKKVLEEIGKKATANDILLLFFAGHGVMSARAGEKQQFYFLTADASKATAASAVADVGISTAELTEWMKPQKIKAQKRILIFDACNSGQAIRDLVKVGNEGQGYIAARSDEQSQQIKAIDKLNEQSGFFILSASASNQSAYEMGRYSQGLLTYSLLKAIKQQPDILADGKYLDVSRWFNAAEKTVTELTKETGARQQPQVISNTNFTIGIVDEEVMAKIVLPQEKPLFTNSNLQNADENIAYDDKELSKLLDAKLSDISARGADGPIVYTPNLKTEEVWILSGRYEVKGNMIIARINIRQGKAAPKYKFELTGTADKLNELAVAIAEKATSLVK